MALLYRFVRIGIGCPGPLRNRPSLSHQRPKGQPRCVVALGLPLLSDADLTQKRGKEGHWPSPAGGGSSSLFQKSARDGLAPISAARREEKKKGRRGSPRDCVVLVVSLILATCVVDCLIDFWDNLDPRAKVSLVLVTGQGSASASASASESENESAT